jgi:hypothetical protein
MITAALITGQGDLADWLWLIAAILFAIVGVIALTEAPAEPAVPADRRFRTDATRAFVPIGLALVAVAWLVL